MKTARCEWKQKEVNPFTGDRHIITMNAFEYNRFINIKIVDVYIYIWFKI